MLKGNDKKYAESENMRATSLPRCKLNKKYCFYVYLKYIFNIANRSLSYIKENKYTNCVLSNRNV